MIKIEFDNKVHDIEIPGRAEMMADLAEFWWEFQKGVAPSLFHSKEGNVITLHEPSYVFEPEFVVLGHLHGIMYDDYVAKDYHLFEYQFEKPIEKFGPVPGKTGIMNPIMVGYENNAYMTVKELLSKYKPTEITQVTMAAIHSFQRAYFYLMPFDFILADARFKFGKNENGDIVFVSTLFSPDSSSFFNINGFKIGAEKNRRMDSSLFLDPSSSKEIKLGRKKYMSHKKYINLASH